MLWLHFFFSNGLRQSKAGQIKDFVAIDNKENPFPVLNADSVQGSETLVPQTVEDSSYYAQKVNEVLEQPVNIETSRKASEKSEKEKIPSNPIESPQKETKKIVLRSGKTLRILAEEVFGSREFWVYFYLENKDKISNPNQVPSGVELVIPNKTSYDINAKNPRSIEKAISYGRNVLKEFR